MVVGLSLVLLIRQCGMMMTVNMVDGERGEKVPYFHFSRRFVWFLCTICVVLFSHSKDGKPSDVASLTVSRKKRENKELLPPSLATTYFSFK